MNHKISEINIEAFRAYNKLQRFDFRHRNSGSAADLVVIYAPNGYGKTSFFDAVEWAVTGTIGRFEKNKIIKQEMGTEKVDILKNRFSSSPQGTVQIVVENGEVFEKKTAKRKGRMNNDYREGEIEVIPPGLSGLLHEKMSFCLTNMLAHDKITTFLQNYSDEDKTKALKGFWDENRVFDSLDTITQLVGQVVQKKKGLSKEIEKGEKELKQYTFENSIESNLVEAIIKFNKHSADLKIDEKTSEDFENISIEVSSILKKIQDWKYSNKEKLSTIEVLLSGYSDYLSNREKLDSVKKEKEKCENKLDLINKVDTLYKQAEELEVEQKILLKVINDWDKFQKIEEELKQIIDSNVEIGKLTQSVNQDISNMNQLMHDCEQRKIKISHSKGLKEKELNIIRENSQRAFDYRKSLQKTYRI